MTTTHFVVPSCSNPRMLPTRRPHPRSSFAWLRASPLQLLKQWLQGTLPDRRTSSTQPTSAARLFQTCSPPARFFFFVLLIGQIFFLHVYVYKNIFVSVFQQAAYHPEVSEEVKNRALMFGSECTTGYIDLLEHVLLVGWALCHWGPSGREREISCCFCLSNNIRCISYALICWSTADRFLLCMKVIR